MSILFDLTAFPLCFLQLIRRRTVNYNINGHPVKFIVEDTQGSPRVGLTKATKLVEKDKVHVIGGVVVSGIAYAIRDFLDQARVPLVISMANAGGLTRKRRSPYIFRTFASGGTGSHYMAQFLYREKGVRTALFSGVDYAYGHEHDEMFKAEFERLGGKVLFSNFAPPGTADFAPYVAELIKHKADGVHFVYSGADGIRFVKAANAYGLKKKALLSNWGATSAGHGLEIQGDAAVGLYGMSTYNFNLDTEANKRFLELDKKKGGRLWFDNLDAMGYVAAQPVLIALKKVKGNIENKEAFLNALRGAKWESPAGPLWFDQRHQNILVNLIIGRVQKLKGPIGEYQNEIIRILKNVQDPWWLEHPEGK